MEKETLKKNGFQKGHPPYGYAKGGWKMTEKHKKDISNSRKGKHYPKLSEVRKQPKYIEIAKNNLPKNQKGKNHPMYGKKRPDIIERNKLRKGVFKHTQKTKNRISESLKKNYQDNPEIAKNIGKKVKRYIQNHPEKWRLNKLLANNRLRITKNQWEWFIKIQNIIGDCVLEYPIKTQKTIRYCDIAIPSLNLDIEIDGKYWHKNKLLDMERDNEFKEIGWETVRISD